MRHAVIVLVAVSCLSVLACAQTAEELVSKNLQAKGGIDKIKSVKTWRMTGRLKNARGRIAVVGQTNMRPDLVRRDAQHAGYDCDPGLRRFHGLADSTFPRTQRARVDGRGYSARLASRRRFRRSACGLRCERATRSNIWGTIMVDGDDALRLKVTLKNGDIIYYYLDPDTFLEIRKEVQEFIRGSVRESVTEMGSYKPVAGVMYPFSISQGSKANPAAQTTTVEKIEVNVNIDPADFAVPASLKTEEKKSGLVGIH